MILDINLATKLGQCAYCEDEKQVKIWDKTGEMVCYDCRVDLLNQEFDV